MSRDEIVSLALVACFAAWITAHLALVAGLVVRRPRWRALAALVVPPLAALWGWRSGMRGRAAVWLAGAMGYVASRWLAGR